MREWDGIHTPVTEKDRLGHDWYRCTTCGALSSFWPLTTGCLGSRDQRAVTDGEKPSTEERDDG